MYIIIELQTQSDGTLGNIVQTAQTINQAKSIYHNILSFAAVSEIPIHACTLLDENGLQIACETYRHGQVDEQIVDIPEESE